MYTDPTGHGLESFWNSIGNWFANNWQWVAETAIIVACAVLTVVTAGGFAAVGGAILSVFTSIMAVNAAAATFAGAFVGSVLFAGVGTVIGGFISTSNGGSFLDGDKWGRWRSYRICYWCRLGVCSLRFASCWNMGVRVDINSLQNNPADEFVTIGPRDGGMSGYMRSISETGNYGQIYAKQISDDVFQIANGHHRVAALKRLGYRFINIFLVP